MYLKGATFLLICASLVYGNVIIQNNNVLYSGLEDFLQCKSDNSKISRCTKQLCQVILNIQNADERWAFKMFDASSKIPTGISLGNIADLGSYDQCLSIEVKYDNDVIQGKYCKASYPLNKIMNLTATYQEPDNFKNGFPESRGVVNLNSATPQLSLAYCVPDSCDAKQLNAILKYIPDFKFGNCQSQNDDESLNAGDWSAVVFLSAILAIIVFSTLYDLYLKHTLKQPAHLILVAFSFYSNGKKLLAVSNNPNQLPCLNGIRFISMMWVIIGHTYYTAFFSPSVNSLETLQWLENLSSMYVIGATVSVDTFFVLGGLLMAYVYLSAKEKKIKFNIFMYYIHRYLRLTPSLAVAILVHVTLLRFLGSGPNWPEILKSLEINCSKYWWSTLLYVQNYVNPAEMCIGQTWYLSVDMQIFILSPLVLLPLGKWPKYTLYACGFLVVASIATPFATTWVDEIPGLIPQAFTNKNFNKSYYMNTYTRFGPTIVGIILGYFVYTRKQNHRLNSAFRKFYFNICGWLVALATMLLVVFAGNNMYFHEYNRFESSSFLALHRVAWSIALAWVIYACLQGHGGLINSFLSLPIFQILGRLTYSMYLIHLSLQTMRIGYLRVPIHFSDLENMHNFWGDFIFTVAISICWTLAFESPMIIIEKIIFQGCKPPRKDTNGVAVQT